MCAAGSNTNYKTTGNILFNLIKPQPLQGYARQYAFMNMSSLFMMCNK